MEYYNLCDFIKKHIRYQQHWNKKNIGLTDAKWQTLKHDTHVAGYDYAKGSQFKVFETTNFGWIVFPFETTVSPDGTKPGKLIHKW